ncbi:hypothetical protein AB0L86_04875 [Micromonospora musae]|uniref:hypothetical protein n=1 Tax=Micromonospora musae TaxID=1894970 RepID=UPI00342A44A7
MSDFRTVRDAIRAKTGDLLTTRVDADGRPTTDAPKVLDLTGALTRSAEPDTAPADTVPTEPLPGENAQRIRDAARRAGL